MSYPLIICLQHQIFNSEWSDDSKLVVWAASLTSFFGSFRLGEILPKSENYNVEEILIWSDVKLEMKTHKNFLFWKESNPPRIYGIVNFQ
jgi:hypothetical protein